MAFIPYHFRDPDYIQDLKEKQLVNNFNSSASSADIHLIWNSLRQTTTAHGIPHVDHARGKFKRCFWAVIAAAAFCFVLFNLYAITEAYLAHKVVMEVKLNHQRELLFPALTICNMNPFRRSALLGNIPVAKSQKQNVSRRTLAAKPRVRRATGICTRWFVEHNAKCYFVSPNVGNVLANKYYCGVYSSVPVSIRNEREKNYIATLTNTTTTRYRIGLMKTDGSWSWFDGTPLTYTNWNEAASEPSDAGECVIIGPGDYWYASDCYDLYHFVCWTNATNITYDDTTIGMSPTTTSYIPTTTSEIQTTITTHNEPVTTMTTHQDTTTTQQTIPPTHQAIVTSAAETSVTSATTASWIEEMTQMASTTRSPSHNKGQCCSCCFSTIELSNISENYAASLSGCVHCNVPEEKVVLTPMTTTASSTGTIDIEGAYEDEKRLEEFLANLSENDKARFGYRLPELIVRSHFSGYAVPLSDFENFYNPVHGNCYIFNSGWNPNITVKRASKAGRRYGLHMIMNVNQWDYMKPGIDIAGIKLVIHAQRTMPFPEDEGIILSPGHATSVGIRQVEVIRQRQPYGDCLSPDDDHSNINIYEQVYPVTYSSKACKKTCYQRLVIDLCRCTDINIPRYGMALYKNHIPVCGSKNRIQEECKKQVKAMFINKSLPCNCPASCRETSFSQVVSIGKWPSNVRKKEILREYEAQNRNLRNISADSLFKQNLLKLEIYYEELNYKSIKERPVYTLGSYLSDIGGVLGLWVGFSVMTLGEFLEFGIDLIAHGCLVCCIHVRKLWWRGRKTTLNTEADI